MPFRPHQKALSRRESTVYNKAVRALAHKGGMTAHEAVGKLNGYRTVTRDKPWRVYGYHPDRLHEDGSFYVSLVQVDDGALHLDDEDVYDFKVDFPVHEEQTRQTNMTVSLIDIAKPARRKVRAKKSVMTPQAADYHFEDFIELDYDDAFSIFSEDWEDLCSNDDVGHEGTSSSR